MRLSMYLKAANNGKPSAPPTGAVFELFIKDKPALHPVKPAPRASDADPS